MFNSRKPGEYFLRPAIGFTHEKTVNKRGQGKRVGNRGPAGYYQGLIIASLTVLQVYPAHFQDIQQVGQGKLIAYGKGQDIKIPQHPARF